MDYETRESLTRRTDPYIALITGAVAAIFVALEGVTLLALGWAGLSLIHLLSFEWGRNPEWYPDEITRNRHLITAVLLLIPLTFFVADLVLLLTGGV